MVNTRTVLVDDNLLKYSSTGSSQWNTGQGHTSQFINSSTHDAARSGLSFAYSFYGTHDVSVEDALSNASRFQEPHLHGPAFFGKRKTCPSPSLLTMEARRRATPVVVTKNQTYTHNYAKSII